MLQGIEVGDLLIAPPNISDSRFEKAVLLLTHDTIYGSIAFCVNRPSNHKLNDIIKELDLELPDNFNLYWGGPVHQNTVWMLHEAEWSCEHTISVNDNWALTSHTSMFQHLADGDYPNRFRFFFGQASWAPGQLEGELSGEHPWKKSHSWLIAKQADPEWLLETSYRELWVESTQICSEQAIDRWM